jgi:PAS domain-containing protein
MRSGIGWQPKTVSPLAHVDYSNTTNSTFDLLDRIPVGMAVLDDDYAVLWWNRQLATWTGIDADQVKGTCLGGRIPQLQSLDRSHWAAVFTKGVEVVLPLPLDLVSQSSDARLQCTIITAIPQASGEGFHALLTFQRLPASAVASDPPHVLHQTQQALAASETRLDDLAASMSGMLHQLSMQVDGSLQFTYVSSGYQAIFELDPDTSDRHLHDWLDWIDVDDRLQLLKALLSSARSLHPCHWEGRLILPSGQVKWLQISSRPHNLERHSTGYYQSTSR